MLKGKRIVLSIIIGVGFMLCCATEVLGQQEYLELLEKGVGKASRFRNPFAGIMSRGKFKPISGLDHKDAVPFLIDVVKSGPQGSVRLSRGPNPRLARCYGAVCLGAIKDPRALEPLIQAMKTEDKEDQQANVSHYAARALGMLGEPQAIDPLIEALKDERSSVANGAAHGLGVLGNLRAIEPLMKALEDKRSGVRGGAAHALGMLIKEEGAALGALRTVAETHADGFTRAAAERSVKKIQLRIKKQKEKKE